MENFRPAAARKVSVSSLRFRTASTRARMRLMCVVAASTVCSSGFIWAMDAR